MLLLFLIIPLVDVVVAEEIGIKQQWNTFPWDIVQECISPRKDFDPPSELKKEAPWSQNKNDPPIKYMNCDMSNISYWGQHKEDSVIYNRFFKDKQLKGTGFFLEMGALGILNSNATENNLFLFMINSIYVVLLLFFCMYLYSKTVLCFRIQ